MPKQPNEYPAAVARRLASLKSSLRRATGWAVFEPNGEVLWAEVRRRLETRLMKAWKSGTFTGMFVGTKANQTFFVRCDRTTMTQADLDQGRLICLVGVSVLRPAEFVIFRIGQWTASREG